MRKMKILSAAVASAAVLVAFGGSVFAAGDAAKGKEVFTSAMCATCHQVGPGAKNGVGPELNGIVGRKAGLPDAQQRADVIAYLKTQQ
jgi:cytochrome c